MLHLILAALGGLLLGVAITMTLGALELSRARRRQAQQSKAIERYRVLAGAQHPEWN